MDYLTVGQIVGTHGIRGEVKVIHRTDFPDVRFQRDRKLYVSMPDHERLEQLEVESSRIHKNMYLLRFKGKDNINDVERYKGGTLKVPIDDKVELDEGEYYFHEIIGCAVETEAGEAVGIVTEILQPGANDVWVASAPGKRPVLIPVIADVVLEVDPKRKRITIRPLEGMIE